MNKKSETFESSITRLEEVIKAMEQGDVPLEQALALFKEGTELAGRCSRLLDEAELTVKKLTKDANGEPVETEFEDA